ncbi:cytochrome c oxidase subunit VIIc [Syncephalis plumigaleata]|nr:cytochrome c oxidase subunit VIIc [Syncephalis plumigaleata]
MFALATRQVTRRAATIAPSVRGQLQRRMFHAENTNGQNLPFSTKNKFGLAVKFTAYCGFGFALPFIASAWTLNKNKQ